jgi:hypothetical protein
MIGRKMTAADEIRMRDSPQRNIRQSHEHYHCKSLSLRLRHSLPSPFGVFAVSPQQIEKLERTTKIPD